MAHIPCMKSTWAHFCQFSLEESISFSLCNFRRQGATYLKVPYKISLLSPSGSFWFGLVWLFFRILKLQELCCQQWKAE